MLLSTAIPIVIAAIVIVIISSGIPSKPIIPKIKKAAIKFGTTPIRDSLKFLNKIINMAKIPTITKPNVSICDLKRLCSKLLNKIKTPASLNSSLLSYDMLNTDEFVLASKVIRFTNSNFNIYEFDGDTSGILNALTLSWPTLFNLDITYLSIRLTALIIISATIYFTYKIINYHLEKTISLLLIAPLILFFYPNEQCCIFNKLIENDD